MASTAVTETYFWKTVKNNLSDEYTHLSRIENTAGTGISDVSGCRKGKEVWIELKVSHGKRVHFRTSQRAWIMTRTGVGGTVWVLIRIEDDVVLYRAKEVLASKFQVAADTKSFSILLTDLPQPVHRSTKPVAWKEISKIIFENNSED